jgi:DNA-binding Lrp family transcriptional regulator
LGAVLNFVFSRRPCTPVVEMFRHWPQIEAYYSLTGPVDGMAIVKVLDSEELSQLINRLSALPGVAQVTSAVIL